MNIFLIRTKIITQNKKCFFLPRYSLQLCKMLYFINYEMPTIAGCAIIWCIIKKEKALLIKLEHRAYHVEFLFYAD